MTVAPGEFERSRETTFAAHGSGVRLNAFQASPNGLFVTITVLGGAVVVDPRTGFPGPGSDEQPGPSVWLALGQRVILSEIQGGSTLHPEQPGDPAASRYDLWFPLDPDEVDDARLEVSWPEVLGDPEGIVITGREIRAAAANALTWPLGLQDSSGPAG